MEGIQHRWDCPARKHVEPDLEVVVVVSRTEHRRCRHCHRKSAVTIRGPVGDPARDLDDEYELDEAGRFRRIPRSAS